jgi:(p)ppGpp synthase/HD superfamily hydrolase
MGLLSTQDQLLLAATVAARAHSHQKRKDGTPYISHPIRVAVRCTTPIEKTAALLHDVIEDSDITIEELRELGFSQVILDIVDKLTKRPGEKYADFIERISTDAIAVQVKIADIADNLEDQSALDPEEAEFLKKRYTKALEVLRNSN